MNNRSFLRSFSHFFSGTFFSRILGMVREICMAFFFGTHPLTAAFFIAFRFANLFRRIFGESALLSSFIPYYEKIRTEKEELGTQFFREVSFSLTVLLLALCLILEGLLFGIKNSFSLENQKIIHLSMIMLPGIIFICLYGLFSAFLQCKKHFFLSSFASVGFNIAWIAAIFFFRNYPIEKAMIGLSFAIVVGFFLQWLIVGIKSFSLCRGLLVLKKWALFSKNVQLMMKAVTFSAIGVGATQINTAMDFLFARFSILQGPAFLSYAIRLEQLPLALVAIGISSVILPVLSRSTDFGQLTYHLKLGLTYVFTLLVPCTLGIWLFGTSGINLIYGHGKFDQVSIIETSYCLWGYALSLVFAGMAIIFSSAFYAKKDFKTPMKASVYTMLCNLLLNTFFIMLLDLPVASVAYATSLSAIFNAAYLYYHLKKAYFLQIFAEIKPEIVKVLFCSFFASIFVYFISSFLLQEISLFSIILHQSFFLQNLVINQLTHFLILATSFLGCFTILGKLMKLEVIEQVFSYKKLSVSE